MHDVSKSKDDLHSSGAERDNSVRVTLRRNLCPTWTHFKHVLLLRCFSSRAGLDTERYITWHLCRVTNNLHFNALQHSTV